jgi:hypothetical protein
MKKYFYLSVASILLAIIVGSCKRMDCSHEPYYFTIIVRRDSPEYPLFLKDSLIDKEVIRLFKSGNMDKPYPIAIKFGDMWGNSSSRNKNLFITTDFEGDFFTGRREVLYLKNRTKTYTLEILGTVEATHCGDYSELKEAFVNGVRQADSITEKQIIRL